MTPKRSSISNAAPKSKSTSSPPLKQGTLAFTSAKRAASTTGATKAKGNRPILKHSSSAQSATKEVIHVEDSSDESKHETDPENDSDFEVVYRDGQPSPDVNLRKSTRQTRSADEGPVKKKQRLGLSVFASRDSTENVGGRKVTSSDSAKVTAKNAERRALQIRKRELDPEDERWREHFGVVREKMGNLQPVHGEDQTMIDHILRVFDLSYEYGPCIGVSRLERWERAQALGLRPPPEVKEILLTNEGSSNERYSQCVFYDEV